MVRGASDLPIKRTPLTPDKSHHEMIYVYYMNTGNSRNWLEKKDLEFLIAQCSYSDDFIMKANDLQVLEAISECYEEYKVLNNSIKNQ